MRFSSKLDDRTAVLLGFRADTECGHSDTVPACRMEMRSTPRASGWPVSTSLSSRVRPSPATSRSMSPSSVPASRGLWTAYYLAQQAPELTIAVVESQVAGFGASGRNGGWCNAHLEGVAAWAAGPMQAQAVALQRAMFDTVDEVGRAAKRRRHRLRLREEWLSERDDQRRRVRAWPGARRRAATAGLHRCRLSLARSPRVRRAGPHGGRARRRLLAALRGHPTREARPWPGPDDRAARRHALRAVACHRAPSGPRAHRGRASLGSRRPPLHGGLLPFAARRSANPASHAHADGRHRAALRRALAGDRRPRPRPLRRRPASAQLRPAHGRRPTRLRCRRPLLLRLHDLRLLPAVGPRLRPRRGRPLRVLPAAARLSRSRVAGVGPSASRGTGSPSSASTAAPGSGRREAISAAASRPRISPHAPSSISCWSGRPSARAIPGCSIARPPGSPSPCAGWA